MLPQAYAYAACYGTTNLNALYFRCNECGCETKH